TQKADYTDLKIQPRPIGAGFKVKKLKVGKTRIAQITQKADYTDLKIQPRPIGAGFKVKKLKVGKLESWKIAKLQSWKVQGEFHSFKKNTKH
ncbi:hypothetical protein ACKGJN_09455, partial [Gillisia sp. Q332]|uniref:hypothetical protein n=1 Tax=Gillisia xinjiangensis TaxID=3384765 RepID=UPI00391B4B35